MADRAGKKSARGEALRAYRETRQKLKEQQEQDPRAVLSLEEDRQTVEKALAQPEDSIVKSITEVRLQIAKEFDSISEKRLGEFKRLSEKALSRFTNQTFSPKALADATAILANHRKGRR